ncbi:MAG: TIGR01777 family oxidoreductase [Planctomycetaceae bacterium]|nr:TIGR01777 family oxidoreductase [Planctomycetaceae bacterium]
MRAVVTGATGFVGRRLLEFIDEPIVLSRDAERARKTLGSLAPTAKFHAWDPLREQAPSDGFDGADAVFHLAGEPVAEGRWTPEKKRLLRESRTTGTANLVRGLAACAARPAVLVSASAVGYYGSRGDEVLTEDKPPADDFLGEICVAWEREAAKAETLGIRVASARIGIVLGAGGGALKKMLPPFKLGLGGRIGDGKQYMPWVHVDDIVGMLLFAATHDSIRGPFNAVGPRPVTNTEFTRSLGKALGRPTIFPVPVLALRLALGEFAGVLTGSQRAVPERMSAAGYPFLYGTPDEALAAAVNGRSKPTNFATAGVLHG